MRNARALPRHRSSSRRHGRGLVLGLLLAGCARYEPRPLDLAAHPTEYRARRLDDPRLLAWVGRWSEAPTARRWSGRQLALAALGTRADLARARADWRAARAGERTAARRPAPGAQGSVERAVSGSEGQSPWVVSLGALLNVELGGKRGARLQQARARTAVAEAELRLTAWSVARETQAAAQRLAGSEADLEAARHEVGALADLEIRERARYQEASLSSAELARTGTEVQAARVDAAAAQAAALDARAALAGALAMPARALDSVTVVTDSTTSCAALDALGADSVETLALTARPEMGRALANYAVSESDLRLEVARQYPDLELGPGFIWDQGVHRWTLALALPNLLGFRNRAAIAEAEAARAAAGARVAETQESLLAEVSMAVSACRGALLEQVAADSQVVVAGQAATLAQAAFERGETSGLEPALAALAVARAERLRNAARARMTAAAQALIAAAGNAAALGAERWPDPREEPTTAEAQR
jgi:outer membrane protein, heavy metal efflux system